MFGCDQRRNRISPWDSHPTHSAGQKPSRSQPQPQSSSSSMIPNVPTFYDPDNNPIDHENVDYQQWLDANAVHHQGNYDYLRHNAASSFPLPYRQPNNHIQQAQPPPVQTSLRSQYNFAQDQYHPPPPAQTQYVAGNQGAPAYQQPQVAPNNEQYFYSRSTPEAIPAQQPVPQSSDSSYQYPQQSYQQTQFALGTSTPESHLVPGRPSSSSEYLSFTATLHSQSSLSPNSDIPAYGSGPTPPPRPGETSISNAIASSSVKKPEQRAAQGGGKGKGRVAKRQRHSEGSTSETDDDDQQHFNSQINIHVEPLPSRSDHIFPTRLSGACTHCKKLKMKCDFPKNQNVCKRCKAGGHQCVVEGRKPRSAPNKREYLLLQIRQKDAIIESLLKQLHNPYLATPLSIAAYRTSTSPSDQNNQNVLAWLDRLTSSHQSSVKAAGGTIGSQAFKIDSRKKDVSDSDSDPDGVTTVRGRGDTGTIHGKDKDANVNTGGGADGSPIDNDDVDKTSALPDVTVPLGLIANLSLSNSSSESPRRRDEDNDDDLGVANQGYFKPGPATDLGIRATLIEQHTPPEILVHGLVTPEDVDKLFDIFYNRLNPHLSLLDPVLHKPSTTFTRCPFLFTVVCAVASRYYTEKSEIYPIAMHFAKHAAANALTDGWKSVELCQAYVLLSTYGVPAKRWEEDRSYLYIGLAIRIATDLNLYMAQPPSKKPMSERQEREVLNKTRAWLICFDLDRSTATQFGKPSTIKDDYVTRNSADWYKQSQYNHPFDIGLCAYTNLLRIVAKFHEELFSDPNSFNGLNKSIDFRTITQEHDENLTNYHKEWTQRFSEIDTRDSGYTFRTSLLPYLVNYSRLVMYSFGFQYAFESGIQPNDIFFTKCFEAAKSVVKILIDTLAPSGYMRFSPDGHFVFATFASAFLLKLLRPEFIGLLMPEDETTIFDLIDRLIQTLSSSDVAIDDRHTPKLHARFLSALLNKCRRDHAASGRLPPQNPPSSQTVRHGPYGPINSSGSSSQVFSISAAQSRPSSQESSNSGQSFEYSVTSTAATTPSNVVDEAPDYQATTRPENSRPREGDYGLMTSLSNLAGEETPATLQALRNPTWWTHMMMPGFTWLPNEPVVSPPANSNPHYHPYHRQMSNTMGGFEMYQMAQVPLSH